MRLLVTGARGYLGGRLIQGLVQHPGWQVTGTTRGTPDEPAGWPAGATLRSLDLLAQDEAGIAAALAGIDTVIHLAAANEIVAVQDPVGATMAGVIATLKLLRAAQAAKCRRFIFLSTIHVYGAPLKGHIRETDQARPLHPYAITHRAAEDFILAAHHKREIEGVVLRLSNGIGAPAWMDVDRWSLVGNMLSRQAVSEHKVVLTSSGLQWRDFILLRDFASAVAHVAEAPAERLGDGLFNLGGRLPLRILDIAQTVARRAGVMLGRDIPVSHAPAAPGESHPTLDYDISRLMATGWAPSAAQALDDEIDATLQLCRTSQGAQS